MSDRLVLEVNAKAPLFKGNDIFDQPIDLAHYRGKKILLGFFRHAGCPFCNMRVHRLLKVHAEMKAKNLEMIFFFESTKEVLLGNYFHKTVSPIPLLSDPEKKIYTAYGIEESKSKSAKSHVTSLIQNVVRAKLAGLPVHWMKGTESVNTIPAEFLIDEQGMVRKIHYSRGLTDQMSMETIMDFINNK